MTFPKLMVHSGRCGYISDRSFERGDIHNKERWHELAEEIRLELELMEKDYQQRWGSSASCLGESGLTT